MNTLFEHNTGAKPGIERMSSITAGDRTAAIIWNGAKRLLSMRTLGAFLLVAAFAHSPLATAQQQDAVFLGSAGSFAVLAGTTVTNTGPSVINGNLGVWPGTAVTGFGPGVVNGSEDAGDVAAQHAQASLNIAYNDAAARTSVAIHHLAGDISGLTLVPGLYKSTSTLSLSGTVTLSGAGVYIFQIASGLTVGTGGTVILSGGATSANVFWQVGSSATLGTTANFKGTILALTSISLATGAKLDGAALAQHGAVTLDTNDVTIALGNAVVVILPPPSHHHD
jgi:Ice-binding-like